ncbi:MAG: alpha/beta hydrolase, partial [Spirochaetales bacterium]|nr:alpha/beta hydrolase [Spirochaetales bacterium]
LGVDREEITLAGSSSGANIAAAACLRARDTGLPLPSRQLLIYPATDLASLETGSYQNFGKAKLGLPKVQMEWFIQHYAERKIDLTESYISPLRAPSLAGLPPAMIITAEFDVVRDEGEEYAKKLEIAGIRTRMIRASGMVHGFLNFTGIIPEATRWMDIITKEYLEFRGFRG